MSRPIRRLLAALALTTLPVAVAHAQQITYEAITFDDTARGFTATTITPTGRPQLLTCEGKLETAQIRIRYDGVDPTAANGTLVDVGNTIRLDGHDALVNFRGIRTGASDGIIRFHCTQAPALELTGTGGSSSGGGGGGDGTIIDGVSAAIAATVFDYANSNPIAVSIVDAAGTIQAIAGGTQVTEDAAAAANPTGTLAMGRRRDTLSAAEVTTDLDIIAANMTSKGELYVKQTDAVPITDNSGSITVDAVSLPLPTGAASLAKQPALGTAGVASSDILTVQGITSMTPLLATLSGVNNITNISGTITLPTGASTAAKQPALGTAGTASADVLTVQGAASMTPVLATLSGTNTVTAVTAITNALPAGTNAIGKLAANAGVNIGDVAVSNLPTTATTSAVAVRCVNTAGNSFESCGGSGGGSSGLTDTELRASAVPVSIATVPSHAVTNAGTFVTQIDGAALTALQLIDNLPKTEDTASADGDTGLVMLARRTATPANTSSADLDYESLQISAGRLFTSTTVDAPLPSGTNNIGQVSIASSALPAGAATSALQPSLGTAGTASSNVLTVQGIASMTPMLATLTGTNNIATVSTVTAVTSLTNALPAGTNAIGKLAANSGVNIGTVDIGTFGLPTGASTAANQATELTSLQLIDNLPNTQGSTTSGQSGALGLGAVTTSAPTYTTAQSSPLSLQTDGSLRVAQSGFTTTAAIAFNTSNPTTTGLQTFGMCWDAVGSNWDPCSPNLDGSHGSSTGAGGPRFLAEATSSVSGKTNVTTGQDSRTTVDLSGVLITRPYANPEDTVTATPVSLTSTVTSTAMLPAAGSGLRNMVLAIECVNTSSTNTTLDIRDGTAGAVLWTMSCPANGGNNRVFTIPLRGSTNTIMAIQSSVSVASLIVSMNGFKGKL